LGRLAVFGYGSLVAPASVSTTLGRDPRPAPLARLEGWRRNWTLVRDNLASEKTFAREDGSLPLHCLGLNLEPDADAPAPNGALIEVTDAELERLDLREIRYSRVDVSEAVTLDGGGVHGFDAVVAYVAKPENHAPAPPPDAVIIATYPRTIEAAFASVGAEALELYNATTAPPPVPVIEATLVADSIPLGNPRDW
jgi:cation transport regulator ChaC